MGRASEGLGLRVAVDYKIVRISQNHPMYQRRKLKLSRRHSTGSGIVITSRPSPNPNPNRVTKTKSSIQIYTSTPPTLAVAALQVRLVHPFCLYLLWENQIVGKARAGFWKSVYFFPTPIMLYAPPSGPTAQGLSSILNNHSRQRQDSACINTAAAAIY